jgi:hypothetical protein
MFVGDHYVGENIHFSLLDTEHWKKTLGPIFIYLNSNLNQNESGNARDLLWQDAKAQVGTWYSFYFIKIVKNNQGTLSCTLINC